MLIEDGKGLGSKMGVDDENMGLVNCVSVSGQHHTNHHHGESYTIDLDGVVIDGDGYYVVSIQNTDDDDLIVTSMTLWVNQNKEDCNVEVYLKGTLASAGTTAITPANCNAGSGETATGTFYVNDGAGNMTVGTTGTICGRMKLFTTPTRWVKESGWILPKNGVMNIMNTKDNKFSGYISFYVHNDQLKH